MQVVLELLDEGQGAHLLHSVDVDAAVEVVIDSYTREAGVRNLERQIASVIRGVAVKVAEGSLRTMSMGGVFHYLEDGRGIFKVSLWEGSLTPIPANQDAIFSVRELTDAEIKKVRVELGA